MKKGALGTVIVVLIIFFVGCSYFSNQLSEKETNALIGTWDCLDENSAGSLVYITKNDNGLTFRYDGEEGTSTKFDSKSEEDGEIDFIFENKKKKKERIY